MAEIFSGLKWAAVRSESNAISVLDMALELDFDVQKSIANPIF